MYVLRARKAPHILSMTIDKFKLKFNKIIMVDHIKTKEQKEDENILAYSHIQYTVRNKNYRLTSCRRRIICTYNTFQVNGSKHVPVTRRKKNQ